MLTCASSFVPAEGSARSWLLTIVRRLAYDLARRKKVREPDGGPQALDVPESEPTAQERVEARERAAAVQTSLNKLTDDDREILLFRDYEGLKAPEVAKVLGISVEKVGSRLHRGSQAVRGKELCTDWPDLFPSRER